MAHRETELEGIVRRAKEFEAEQKAKAPPKLYGVYPHSERPETGHVVREVGDANYRHMTPVKTYHREAAAQKFADALNMRAEAKAHALRES